jgi:signal transduction histidine kinase
VAVLKWWDVAFAAALPLFAVLAWVTYVPSEQARIGAWLVLVALGVCYLAVGRRALRVTGGTGGRGGRRSRGDRIAIWGFLAALVLAPAIGASFCPTLAVTQALLIPCAWSLLDRLSRAIPIVVVIAVGVFIGIVVALGGTSSAISQAAITQTLALIFSIVFGLWINWMGEYANERARLLAELTAAQEQLNAQARDAGVASERERLAREIHDTIAQSLTSLVLLAQRTNGELTAVPADTGVPQETVELIESTAREALVEARGLVAALAPLPQSEQGLRDVLTRLAARFTRETGLAVATSVDGGSIPRELEVVLLRCAQEALANVRKHAKAHTASVEIESGGGTARLRVADDGRGIRLEELETGGGFGVAGMRERVRQVGGELEVGRRPEGGTLLAVTIPLPAEAEHDTATSRESA